MERDEAFTAFVTLHRGRLLRAAYLVCGDAARADDVTQIALSKLYVAWFRVEGDPEAYVRTIIARTAVDESRRPWRREVATDLDERQLGVERDGAADALPPAHDPAADLDRGRRFQRARRQRQAAAVSLVAAALAVAGVAFGSAEGPRTAVPAGPIPTTTGAPTTTPSMSTTPTRTVPPGPSCAGAVQIIGPSAEPVVLTPASVPTVRLRVGDVLRFEGSDRCIAKLDLALAHGEPGSVFRLVDDRTAEAVRVGSASVGTGHGMCEDMPPAQQRGCIGGYVDDGHVKVLVRAR